MASDKLVIERLADKYQEHDILELTEVYGFGEPMLALFLTGESACELQGMNLDLGQAILLRERIDKFLEKHKGKVQRRGF